jgi:tRNA(Ile)-lysidine synthase
MVLCFYFFCLVIKVMTTFISTVQACIDAYSMLPSGARVVVAVSGGADSMALLSTLYQLRAVYNLTLIVAHVNHQLRGPESSRDAVFVEQQAEKLRLPFYQTHIDVKAFQYATGLSPQHAARVLRYDYFQSLCRTLETTCIALGHTADDQVETFLVRLLRGSGPAGLAGIPPVRRPFIRPLITTHRPAILSYLTSEEIAWVEDSTNVQRTYLRNRVRLDLLPILQQINPQISKGLLGLTNMLSAENAVLEQHTDVFAQRTVQWKPGQQAAISRSTYRAAPLAIQRRLLRRIVDVLLPPSSIARFEHIETLRQFVIDGAVGKRCSLPGGGIAECQADTVFLWNSRRFSPTTFTVTMPVPGTVSLPALGMRLVAEVFDKDMQGVERTSEHAIFAMERLRFPLNVRFPRPGDRFFPLGAPGTKKLKDFFIDSKVPRAERTFVPLVVSGADIVWVVGYRIAEPFKVHADTKFVLSLKYETNAPVVPGLERVMHFEVVTRQNV